MKPIAWKNWGVLSLVWGSKGLNNKEASHELQQKLKRRGFSTQSVQRNADLRLPASPDVVKAVLDIETKPKFEDSAEVVRLGLEMLERGPIVDPEVLATSCKAKLPIAEVTSKAVADAFAQAPKPPSADEVAARVEATLARQPKRVARYVARYLSRRTAKPPEPLNTTLLGDEIAQKVSEKLPTHGMDERKIAAAVVRGLLPWIGVGISGLIAVAWIFLHGNDQRVLLVERRPEGSRLAVNELDEHMNRSLLVALGQGRLPLLEGQARPPCREPEQEQDGGCWVELAQKPPCKGDNFEKNGKCWFPVAERRKRVPQAGDGAPSPPPAELPK